ncbi:uncharacterized protein [Thunnus thynnus]|uniref:uncharacterized protein isoform X1 n=1 Tax=Thunnus thynnus TaxID=8237 RepID=UPI003526C70A
MAVWKLWFVLLLLLPAYNNSQVTLVKTTGREPYVTPICTNETLRITLIICKIRTERSRGEECRLMYKYGQDFEHGCDSRFTLMKKNQTIFLNLTSLTPVDSGNYSCECIYPGATNTLHLNITVEVNFSVTVEDEEATSSTKISIASAAVGVTVFIIITGVILGFIHRRKHHRRQQEPLSSRPNTEPQDIEPYSTFMRTESAGLYSTVKIRDSNTNNSNMFTTN